MDSAHPAETAPALPGGSLHVLRVLVALPAHSPLSATPLHYTHSEPLPAGTLVRVPLGARAVLGVVWDDVPLPQQEGLQLRPLLEAFAALPPLDTGWRRLVGFTAHYYQRSMGEVALSALPPQLRDLDGTQLARRLRKLAAGKAAEAGAASSALPLTEQQHAALETLLKPFPSGKAPRPCLLFGSTGSGKTEVYLQAVARTLEQDPAAQVLVMVPEINLTPQLEQRFADRFPAERIAAMHSGLTPAQRLQGWLAAHTGQARIVLGTRMAVLASLPGLRLIVVDEEHDPSYKQQEGARYSARDLAIYRAHHAQARILLGSATPSLESWHQSRPPGDGDAGGRYLRLAMPARIGAAPLPRVRLIDMNHQPRRCVFSPQLLEAMAGRAARGEQSMVLLNRRGYAPVLHCADCGWKSECPHCSAYRVFHKIDRTLRCHHCGFTERVPRACPSCGNLDVQTLGQGTEQLEEALAAELRSLARPDGSPLVIARIDADTTRHAGSLEQQLARVHSGDVDVLVGTQMIAKGHDFRRITLVAALNPDTALFSSDFRAPERLFSLLLQAGGRAGRDAAIGSTSELWVQTRFPAHALFGALQRHDYPAFAAQQLEERAAAGMPPFSYQALVRAESREQQAAQDFLNAAGAAAADLPEAAEVFCYPAIPMTPQRVANRERAQMLLESGNRTALQHFLPQLAHQLHAGRTRAILRWAIDVDPLGI
ncbi:MAG: primosomal protein N' [Brachymonas denitrificans]|uniref:replication restart helicase PriA n=1 Tax=Brachymonas denitrificans TaxID=28220 RepID=UPI00352E345E